MSMIEDCNRMIRVMQHYASGGEVEVRCGKRGEFSSTKMPRWNWHDLDFRIKEKKPDPRYKSIDKDGVFEPEDEYYDCVSKEWRLLCLTDLQPGRTTLLRRPIRDPGPRYRLLGDGDIIKQGDEFFNAEFGDWMLAKHIIGYHVGPGSLSIRRIRDEEEES